MSILIAYETDVRQYTFDYSQVPEIVNGETLTSITVTATPADGFIVVGSTSITGDGTLANVILSGGVVGVTYAIVCVGTTSAYHSITAEGGLYIQPVVAT